MRLLLIPLLTAACHTPPTAVPYDECADAQVAGTDFGVNWSPAYWPDASSSHDVMHFLEAAPTWGGLVAFPGEWRDSREAAGALPARMAIAQSTRDSYCTPVSVGLRWTDDEGTALLDSEEDPGDNSWANHATRAAFVDAVTATAEAVAPDYLFLGHDTNLYADAHPEDWSNWIDALGEAYDAAKAASPDTVVFTVLQLDRLKGRASLNGWSSTPQWDLLDDIEDRTDALGLTSYPYFDGDIPSPDALEAAYYAEILDHWGGPMIFTETAWSADPAPPYEGSEEEQAAYADRFFELTTDLDIDYAAWRFLHDLPAEEEQAAFSMTGLRSNDGETIRQADWQWREGLETSR